MRSKAVSELAAYTAPANKPEAASVVFMPDGKNFVQRTPDGRKLVLKDALTGKENGTLFDVDNARETSIPDFDGFIISPDGSKVMVWREADAIYRHSRVAKHYVYEVRSRLLRPLSEEHDYQRDPIFSPDSRMVAFVSDNNIYAAKLDYQTEVAVTTDGNENKIINGATDWTYEEEFGTTALMAWAPDNLTLCYVKTNESKVRMYTLPIYEGTCDRNEKYALYPGTLSYKYPMAGETNSSVTLHSYDVETRKTKQLQLPGDAGYYIPRIAFRPSETENTLLVSTLNRDQNHYEIFGINPRTTVAKSLYRYDSKAWIMSQSYSSITLEPESFVLASDADGHTRYYRYSYSGAKMGAVTPADVDATAYYGKDAAGNVYYQTASPTPMDRTVHKAEAKTGKTLILGKNSGTTGANFAPACGLFVMSHSSITEVPTYSMCKNDGKELYSMVSNKAYADSKASLRAPKEFIKIKNAAGEDMNAFIIKPRDFNPSKRYPVIMSQYSGPGSQEVLNKWTLGWEDYFASRGYIVICADGRGTGGRGAAWRTAVYKQLGTLETQDQVAAARYAASLPYVDPSRIGIYGWSYGGYEALMCASADECPYAAAVSIAPVTDWRYYDSVYTERYMLTPQQNEKGYSTSSAIKRSLYLSCPLLMMYGTADDNVHPANTLQYVSTLQSAGIMCDMFVFPQMNHSINGCNARAVVYAKMLEYFDAKLK